MTRRASSALGSLLLLLLFAGCGGSEAASNGQPEADAGSEPPAASASATEAIATQSVAAQAQELGVANARAPLPGLITAGQPDEAQLAALADAGIGTAVSFRPEGEPGAGWEEAFAADHPLTFHRIPVAGAADLSRETVEELDGLLAEAGDGPTLLYCASSNRVGALLALRAHWLQDVPAEEALQLGREAGLRSLEPAVAELLGMEDR